MMQFLSMRGEGKMTKVDTQKEEEQMPKCFLGLWGDCYECVCVCVFYSFIFLSDSNS
jgi:hypothetical protein